MISEIAMNSSILAVVWRATRQIQRFGAGAAKGLLRIAK
jgi:hypothetical protein